MPNDVVYKYVIGVDEVGRGPLFGPVVAAAVLFPIEFDFEKYLPFLTDSKKLSAKKREKLEVLIKDYALNYSIAEASVVEIDTVNILQASLLAMKRAVENLNLLNNIQKSSVEVLVDGNKSPNIGYNHRTIVQGDLIEPSISAASILAKEYRDRLINEMALKYSNYDLVSNKGYPTKRHLDALIKYGVSDMHRTSFAPVAKLISHK